MEHRDKVFGAYLYINNFLFASVTTLHIHDSKLYIYDKMENPKDIKKKSLTYNKNSLLIKPMRQDLQNTFYYLCLLHYINSLQFIIVMFPIFSLKLKWNIIAAHFIYF